MATPQFSICVTCGFRVPSPEYGFYPHICPKAGSVKVYNEEEKRALEKKRLAEDANKKKRRGLKPPPAFQYIWPRSRKA